MRRGIFDRTVTSDQLRNIYQILLNEPSSEEIEQGIRETRYVLQEDMYQFPEVEVVHGIRDELIGDFSGLDQDLSEIDMYGGLGSSLGIRLGEVQGGRSLAALGLAQELGMSYKDADALFKRAIRTGRLEREARAINSVKKQDANIRSAERMRSVRSIAKQQNLPMSRSSQKSSMKEAWSGFHREQAKQPIEFEEFLELAEEVPPLPEIVEEVGQGIRRKQPRRYVRRHM